MVKEAQEKIAEARLTYIILNWRDNLDNTRMTPQKLAQTLMRVLTEEFGYRKLPEGKPPLLSDEELDKLWRFCYGYKHQAKAIAQAQRNSDIKWHGGENSG